MPCCTALTALTALTVVTLDRTIVTFDSFVHHRTGHAEPEVHEQVRIRRRASPVRCNGRWSSPAVEWTSQESDVRVS